MSRTDRILYGEALVASPTVSFDVKLEWYLRHVTQHPNAVYYAVVLTTAIQELAAQCGDTSDVDVRDPDTWPPILVATGRPETGYRELAQLARQLDLDGIIIPYVDWHWGRQSW